MAKLGLFLHPRFRNIKFHSKLQRKAFIRETCPFLTSSQKSGTKVCRKIIPCLNPTESPHIPDPVLCSSTVLTAPVTLLPTHSLPTCNLSSWCLLNRVCSLGVPMGYNHPTPCSLFSLASPFSPSAKTPLFRTRKEHLSQPPSVSASPLPSSLPNYYHLPIGLSSVLCLLKLSMPLFHGARVWGGNSLLHCPLRCYRRLQAPLIQHCPLCPTQTRCLPYSPLECPLKKTNPFSHTY